MVCRFELPATIETSVEPGVTTPVPQSIGNVPKLTQGAAALLLPVPEQVGLGLFTLVHKWSPAVGKVKFNGTACARLTGLSVGGGNSPENPVNEDTEPVVTAAALGSKATTQQDVAPNVPSPTKESESRCDSD